MPIMIVISFFFITIPHLLIISTRMYFFRVYYSLYHVNRISKKLKKYLFFVVNTMPICFCDTRTDKSLTIACKSLRLRKTHKRYGTSVLFLTIIQLIKVTEVFYLLPLLLAVFSYDTFHYFTSAIICSRLLNTPCSFSSDKQLSNSSFENCRI